MANLKDYIKPGISATMLYPGAFTDEAAHLAAIEAACRLPDYELLDLYLPQDEKIRGEEMELLRSSGKTIHLNTPPLLQQDGPYNPCSDDETVRARALELMLEHIRYAGELSVPVIVYTANVDKGETIRPVLLERFYEFVKTSEKEARQQNVVLALEPIERHRFKKLFLGPTEECCAFTERLQQDGCKNVGVIVDITHLPLMEEPVEPAFVRSMQTGVYHVHLGGAVLEPSSPFYGHTHPPLGVADGLFDTPELEEQLRCMVRCGYIAPGRRAPMTFEVQAMPGCTPEETAAIHYGKLETAFAAVAESEGLR